RRGARAHRGPAPAAGDLRPVPAPDPPPRPGRGGVGVMAQMQQAGRLVTLFSTCPLPGCKNPTDDPRQPCPECLAAFGDRPPPAGEPVTADEFAAQVERRDEEVREILAERRAMVPLAAPQPGAEWKQGQRCGVCEDRRK